MHSMSLGSHAMLSSVQEGFTILACVFSLSVKNHTRLISYLIAQINLSLFPDILCFLNVKDMYQLVCESI